MDFFRSIAGIACTLAILILTASCSGNSDQIKTLEAERDSLAAVANDATLRYDDLSGFLNEISDCVDSITVQEGALLMTRDAETGRYFTKAELRQRIANLGSIIERQRTKIASISDSLQTKKLNTGEVERLTQLVAFLNQQLAAKEAEVKQLQQKLMTSNKTIAELKTTVEAAHTANEQLTTDNAALDKLVEEKTSQLGQGWFMAKTKKDLEEMGVLSKGGFLKKSKFNPGAVSTSSCMPVDINTFTQVELNSKKKPQLLSQAPSSSYVFEEVSKGKWRLLITDTLSFWSLSKIVVIQLQ